VGRLFNEISKSLLEKDYKIPRIKSEVFSGWVYTYGDTMAYFAIQNFTDTTLAMQFIYRLGQIRDSKKLEDFKSNLADGPESPLEDENSIVIDELRASIEEKIWDIHLLESSNPKFKNDRIFILGNKVLLTG